MSAVDRCVAALQASVTYRVGQMADERMRALIASRGTLDVIREMNGADDYRFLGVPVTLDQLKAFAEAARAQA